MAGIVLGGTLLGTLLALLLARRIDENHLVSGRILLQIGRELGAARPTMVGENSVVQANPRREDVNTEAEMLGSPALIERCFKELVEEKVIELKEPTGLMPVLRKISEWLGLTSPKTIEARMLEKWSQSMTVYAVAGSNVLGVECRTNEPAIGKVFLDKMIKQYLEAHLKAYSTASSETFFQAEVARLEKILIGYEAEMSKFRIDTHVFDIDSERSLAMTRRGEAEALKRTTEARFAAAKARAEQLAQTLEAYPPTLVLQAERKVNPVHDELEKRGADARSALIQAQSQYPEDSPYVTRAKTLAEEVTRMLAAQPVEREDSKVVGPNQVHMTIAQELAKARADHKALEAEVLVASEAVAFWDHRVVEIEEARPKFAKLIILLAEAQRDLSHALGTARLSRIGKQLDDLQIANVVVIVPPTITPTPIRTFGLPTRVAVTMQGTLLGLVLGLAVAFLIHARQAHAAQARAPAPAKAWQEHEGLT